MGSLSDRGSFDVSAVSSVQSSESSEESILAFLVYLIKTTDYFGGVFSFSSQGLHSVAEV